MFEQLKPYERTFEEGELISILGIEDIVNEESKEDLLQFLLHKIKEHGFTLIRPISESDIGEIRDIVFDILMNTRLSDENKYIGLIVNYINGDIIDTALFQTECSSSYNIIKWDIINYAECE